jgi:hypothetical protein
MFRAEQIKFKTQDYHHIAPINVWFPKVDTTLQKTACAVACAALHLNDVSLMIPII